MATFKNFRFPLIALPIVTVLAILLLHFGWRHWPVATAQSLGVTSTTETSLLQGHYYEASITPIETDWYVSADYRLWIPSNAAHLRGLLVKQHGCGEAAEQTGLNHANDLQWQALATKHHLAILGTRISAGDRLCEFWADINGGSVDAFFKALYLLAQKSDHPELETIPWVLWGHSGGAEWVAQLLYRDPKRVVAMVAARGGGYYLIGSNQLMLEVPVLFAVGEKDPFEYDCIEVPQQVFDQYRKRGAPWSIAVEAGAAHETGDIRWLAIPYLDAILTARLPTEGETLRPVDIDQGWLGDRSNQTVAPVKQFKGNVAAAVWLPNQETARKWQEYVTTGQISPTQKPSAPNQLKAVKTSPGTVMLTWNFVPDLENGLPSFRVYRDNTLIQTFQGQEHNFGDAPEPVQVALRFQDRNPSHNSVYTVSAFNALGETISQAVKLPSES